MCPAGRARCPLVENLGFRHRAIKLVCNNFTSEIRLEKHPRIDDDETKPFRQCIVVFSNVRGLVRQEKFCSPRLGNRTSLIIGIQQILCSRSKPVVARGLWGRLTLSRPGGATAELPGHAWARCYPLVPRGARGVVWASGNTLRRCEGAKWTDPGCVSNARNTFLWILFRSPQNLPHPRRNFLESRVDRRVALMQGTRTLPSVVFPVSVSARHAVWSHFPV